MQGSAVSLTGIPGLGGLGPRCGSRPCHSGLGSGVVMSVAGHSPGHSGPPPAVGKELSLVVRKPQMGLGAKAGRKEVSWCLGSAG